MKGSTNSLIEKDAVKFHLQKGTLIFSKKNFKPKGEIFLYSVNHLVGESVFDYENQSLPFSYYQQQNIPAIASSDFNRKILKNLPFARRGFVFKDKELQNYFENLDWYVPNPNYEPNSEIFPDIEKDWIEKWK